MITKGDLFDQENKIARSGLGEEFDIIEVVSEKDEATYRSLLQRHAIDPAHFLMLGNSLRNYEITWHHEAVTESAEEYWQPESLEVAVKAILVARG